MAYTGSLPNTVVKSTPRFNNGHWIFEEQLGGKDYVGFIYVIYDKVLNRAYIGKKHFYLAGKLNKGQESQWRKYKSSSTVLAEMFKERPKDEFEFQVLEQYKTKGTLSYSESWSLCFVEAPTSKVFYNTLIEKVSWAVKEPISDRHKQRLVELLERIKCNS
jgi:hypothetical protein